MRKKLHTGDIEVVVARYFGYRRCLIVPNISWGLGFRHELDLIVVRPSGYALEIEIKVSLSDLRADQKKRHGHRSDKIKELYFAVPEDLEDKAENLIPERAGLIVIRYIDRWGQYNADAVRPAKTNKTARKLTAGEITKLGGLAAMRIWTLKNVIYRLQREKYKNSS